MKTTINLILMSKVILPALLLVMSLSLPACIEDPDNPTPSSNVPEGMARKWSAGYFSMGEFWEYDGSYNGNAFETGLAFDFKPDGKCEFYLVAGGTSYSCRNELFVYKKGTVEFHNNGTFTFHPTEGRSRGYFKGCASAYQNYDNKTEKKDLKPEIYQYTLGKDSNGISQLNIRSDQQNIVSTNFYPASW